MSNIDVVSQKLVVKKCIDALIIRGYCTVEYDSHAMSFAQISTILAVDVINPIVAKREFLEDSVLIQRLVESGGKLVLYWREGVDSLEEYEHFWENWHPGLTADPTIVFITSFRLFERDQLYDSPWFKVYDLQFDHSKL